jgi:hypothetical protein
MGIEEMRVPGILSVELPHLGLAPRGHFLSQREREGGVTSS